MKLVFGVVILGLARHASALCEDLQSSSDCASWKSNGYCDSGQFQPWMKKNCAKTCGECNGPPTQPLPADCEDASSYCDSYKYYCDDPDYKDYLIQNCKRTCNFCHITTQPPPTTQYISTKPYTGAGGRDLQPGCGHKGPGHTRIVGGTNAKPGDWPWQASVHYEKSPGIQKQWCGGTLIDEEWVLCAAHCFDNKDATQYHVKLGEHNLKEHSNFEQRRQALEVHVHPQYNTENQDYDLALIKIKKVQLNERVRTACLPGGNTHFPDGTMCTISGWGKLAEFGDGPAILQQAQVPLTNHDDCEKAYGKHGYAVTNRMKCAADGKGKIDSCGGDSGGPLVCKAKGDIWYVLGATSWGVGCARKGLYGVYADVKVLRPWVDKVVFNM